MTTHDQPVRRYHETRTGQRIEVCGDRYRYGKATSRSWSAWKPLVGHYRETFDEKLADGRIVSVGDQ